MAASGCWVGGWGSTPVPAKLMVESALFFVNFAVQRLFIFQLRHAARREARPLRRVAAVGGVRRAGRRGDIRLPSSACSPRISGTPPAWQRFWRYLRDLFADRRRCAGAVRRASFFR